MERFLASRSPRDSLSKGCISFQSATSMATTMPVLGKDNADASCSLYSLQPLSDAIDKRVLELAN